MKTVEIYAVFSCHQCTDGDYDQLEFNTDCKEYAEQWVYAACRAAKDWSAYHWEPIELRITKK